MPPYLLHSMDKLYDLMTMGLKYQLLCATRLSQMLEVGSSGRTYAHARRRAC